MDIITPICDVCDHEYSVHTISGLCTKCQKQCWARVDESKLYQSKDLPEEKDVSSTKTE